jgi:hypothetical protein
MVEIPNAELTQSKVPGAQARWREIEVFAVTFNGYARIGKGLGELSSRHRDAGTVPSSLDELRGCLFIEQRSWRHVGGTPDEKAMRYVRALIEAIRAAVPSGSVD